MSKVKAIRYFNNTIIDFTYTLDDGKDFPCERDLSGDYYPSAEVERLVEAAKGALHFIPFLSGYHKELEATLAAVEGK